MPFIPGSCKPVFRLPKSRQHAAKRGREAARGPATIHRARLCRIGPAPKSSPFAAQSPVRRLTDPIGVKHVRSIAIVLCLGLLIDVVVGWACAWWAELEFNLDFETSHEDIAEFKAAVPTVVTDGLLSDIRHVDFQAWEQTGFGVELREYSAWYPRGVSASQLGNHQEQAFAREACLVGLPMRSLRSTTWRAPGITVVVYNLPVKRELFPMRPVFPGFPANTLLFAAAIWTIILGPSTLRRYLRRRRGLCITCGYPIGDSSVCPECGAELSDVA